MEARYNWFRVGNYVKVDFVMRYCLLLHRERQLWGVTSAVCSEKDLK